MKCDELKKQTRDVDYGLGPISVTFYEADAVDEAIAELKESLERQKNAYLKLDDMYQRDTGIVCKAMKPGVPCAEMKKVMSENESLRSKNEGLLYALADAETDLAMATRWRKCSEELPEDDSEVLATDGEGIWLCYKTTTPDGSPWFQPNGLPHIEGITHWMPMPKAPEVK